MGSPAELLVLPPELVRLIRQKRCIAFIGSGPSIDCYKDWQDLVNHLCERCGSQYRVDGNSPPEAYMDAAQDAKDCNENRYYQVLGERFGTQTDRTSEIYAALVNLPFKSYVTTNYDPKLARAARQARLECTFPIMAYPKLDRAVIRDRTIYYLHGYIDEDTIPEPGTIVLARSEFDEAYDPHSSLVAFLGPMLDDDPICFIGCGLREPMLEQLFKYCKERQARRIQLIERQGCRPTNPPPRYIFLAKSNTLVDRQVGTLIDQELHRQTEERFETFGIKVVWYAPQGSSHAQLRAAFEQLAELPSIAPDHGWAGGSNVN